MDKCYIALISSRKIANATFVNVVFKCIQASSANGADLCCQIVKTFTNKRRQATGILSYFHIFDKFENHRRAFPV